MFGKDPLILQYTPTPKGDKTPQPLRFLDYKMKNEDLLSKISVKYINGIEVDRAELEYIENSIDKYIEFQSKGIQGINGHFDLMHQYINSYKGDGWGHSTDREEKMTKTIHTKFKNIDGIETHTGKELLNFIYNNARNEVERYLFSIRKICDFHKLIETNAWLDVNSTPPADP